MHVDIFNLRVGDWCERRVAQVWIDNNEKLWVAFNEHASEDDMARAQALLRTARQCFPDSTWGQLGYVAADTGSRSGQFGLTTMVHGDSMCPFAESEELALSFSGETLADLADQT